MITSLPGPRPTVSSSSWSESSRPSSPSSSTYWEISSEIRRTISWRCRVTATSRTVTMASISRADRELVTWSRRER